MLVPIIVCGVILLVLIIMYFVYNNREVALRKEADAQRGKIPNNIAKFLKRSIPS